jgi:Methyltransferase domain
MSDDLKRRMVKAPRTAELISLDDSLPRLTSAHETRILCWLAQRVPGNIIELGCNKGLTTRELALSNPTKMIYAVDCFLKKGFYDWQSAERPAADDFCVFARDLPNVTVIHADSGKLNYNAFVDPSFFFIDGDHTFGGVKADTECILQYALQRGQASIVWHDYYEGGPAWLGVKSYVDSLSIPMSAIEDTWLAVAQIGRDGALDVLANSTFDY